MAEPAGPPAPDGAGDGRAHPGARGGARDGARDGPPAYLIVLRHVLVAQDIALTIAESHPGAEVLLAAAPAEGLLLVERVPRLAVAFVGEGPGRFAGSPLHQAVAERGGRVVLMGEEAEARGEAEGFAVLARPFSSGAVALHLPPRPTAPGDVGRADVGQGEGGQGNGGRGDGG